MGMPGYQEFMLPLMKIAADGREHRASEVMESLATQMGVSSEEQAVLLPSGLQTRYHNRVTWALTYLVKSQLLERVARGKFRITQRGAEVLRTKPSCIDNAFLEQFEEYREFKAKKNIQLPTPNATEHDVGTEVTPEERLESAYQELRETLADDVLRRVRGGSPKFFEYLVVRLLVAMGYGGGQIDQADVTGKTGDEGIDGVIREDRLGLDMVYVQAKKWDNSVGPGEIDKFVGSLMRKKATKGVFITSGTFTEGANRAAREAAVKVRLINGEELVGLMIDHDVGVSPAEKYIMKKVDSDFFDVIS